MIEQTLAENLHVDPITSTSDLTPQSPGDLRSPWYDYQAADERLLQAQVYAEFSADYIQRPQRYLNAEQIAASLAESRHSSEISSTDLSEQITAQSPAVSRNETQAGSMECPPTASTPDLLPVRCGGKTQHQPGITGRSCVRCRGDSCRPLRDILREIKPLFLFGTPREMIMYAIFLFVTLVVMGLRLFAGSMPPLMLDFYKDLAHVYVGGLFGAAWFGRQSRSFRKLWGENRDTFMRLDVYAQDLWFGAWLLTVWECLCFALTKMGVL